MRTQGEIEAAICEGMSRFEQDYKGRGLKEIHRLYMGKWITGIIFLLTGGLVGLGLHYELWTVNGQISEINRQELVVGG